MTTWYCAITVPSAEKRAYEGLVEQRIEAYLPMEAHWKRKANDRSRRVYTPVFPGYVFVGVSRDEEFRLVRAVDGIQGFVVGADGGARKPAPVSYEALTEIRTLEEAGLFDYTKKRKMIFEPKQLVRVVGGQFTGFMAEVLHAVDGERIKVLFKARGVFGAGPSTLSADQLEAAA